MCEGSVFSKKNWLLLILLHHEVDRLLTGITAQQKGTIARRYSNKTALHEKFLWSNSTTEPNNPDKGDMAMHTANDVGHLAMDTVHTVGHAAMDTVHGVGDLTFNTVNTVNKFVNDGFSPVSNLVNTGFNFAFSPFLSSGNSNHNNRSKMRKISG